MCQACTPGTLAALRAITPRPIAQAPSARTGPASTPGPAEVLLTGATVLTLDPAGTRARAIAIRGGRILAVGDASDLDGLTDAGTRVLDLDGRTVLPGFVDPHMHLAFVQLDDWIDVTPMALPDLPSILARLRGGAAHADADAWIRARGYDPSITEGGRPLTRAELDAVAPANPLFVLESNGHVGYANSRALALAGYTEDSPDPPAARICRDAAGAPNGRLEESAAFLPVVARMPATGPAELVGRARGLFESAAAVGCTSLHDCGIGMLSGADDLDLIRAAMGDDSPVRYRGMLVSTALDTWEEMGLRPGFGDDMFRVDGVKAWSDGSNQGGTGFQREPYLGGTSRGALNYSPQELAATVRRAHDAGWQVGVHANGDAAIDVTLDAYERALAATPRRDHRHRIEHCSVLHPEQIERMSRLGVSPSFLIGHIRWWGRAFRDRLLGPERTQRYDPCASALAAGLRISLHSDFNVTPIDPLRCVEDAVTRVMREGGEVLGPGERIPVEAALRAVTVDAAWQCRMDDIVGSLEPGKYADLAVLDADPTAVEPGCLSSIAVTETWVAGERRFAR